MADELQNLLEKINAEGVKKAEAERETILSSARKEAEKTLADARKEAERIVAEASAESESLRQRAESAIKQAARDILLELKSELEARLDAAVRDATAQALSPELMAGLVRELTAKFVADPDSEVSVRCAIKDRDALDSALRDALKDSLVKNPRLLGDHTLAGGLEVGVDGERTYFDFSLEAIGDIVSDYVGERVAAVFRDK